MSRETRTLELVLLFGAVAACGGMAVSLLPAVGDGRALLFGIGALLLTPWIAAVAVGVEALRSGKMRRAVLVMALVGLASIALLA